MLSARLSLKQKVHPMVDLIQAILKLKEPKILLLGLAFLMIKAALNAIVLRNKRQRNNGIMLRLDDLTPFENFYL